jgi:hypothetical protein
MHISLPIQTLTVGFVISTNQPLKARGLLPPVRNYTCPQSNIKLEKIYKKLLIVHQYNTPLCTRMQAVGKIRRKRGGGKNADILSRRPKVLF